MIYLQLFWEFFKTGLFAVGGGMATLPFLQAIGESTGWYTYTDLIATLGEVTPSIIVILIVAAVLQSFRNNKYVDRAFYGLRPASTGLIGAACVSVILEVLTGVRLAVLSGIVKAPVLSGDSLLNMPGLLLAAALIVLTNYVPRVKKLHPIVFIGLSAAVGVVFRFAGA